MSSPSAPNVYVLFHAYGYFCAFLSSLSTVIWWQINKQIEFFHTEQRFDIILAFTNTKMEVSCLFIGVNVIAWILWGKPSAQPQIDRITFCALLHMSVLTFWAFHQLSTSSENWSVLVREAYKQSQKRVVFSHCSIFRLNSCCYFKISSARKYKHQDPHLCSLPRPAAPFPKSPQVTMQSSWQTSALPGPILSKPNIPRPLRAGAACTEGQREEQVCLQWLQPNPTSTHPHSTKVSYFLDQIIWILLVFLFSLYW